MVMFRPLILRGVAGANGQNQFGVWGVPLSSLNREVSKDRLVDVIQMQYCNCGKVEVHVKHPSYRNGDSSLFVLFFCFETGQPLYRFFSRERNPISRFGFVFKKMPQMHFSGGLQILAILATWIIWATKKDPYYFPLYWLFDRDPYNGLL